MGVNSDDHFWFGSVFIKKKITKPNFFYKKPNRNRFKPTGFGSVRLFRTKTGSNRFGSVFSGLAWFFQFGSVFSGLARFFSGLGSVRFSFFDFRLIKLNRTGRFF
jgi:hypothetical protein